MKYCVLVNTVPVLPSLSLCLFYTYSICQLIVDHLKNWCLVVEMTKEEKNFGNDKHSYFALPTLAKKKVSSDWHHESSSNLRFRHFSLRKLKSSWNNLIRRIREYTTRWIRIPGKNVSTGTTRRSRCSSRRRQWRLPDISRGGRWPWRSRLI